MFRDFVCPSPVQVACASSGATRAGQTRAHGHEAQGQDQSIGPCLEQGRINADDPQTPKLKYHGVYHEDNALVLTLTFFALFSCRPSPAPSSPVLQYLPTRHTDLHPLANQSTAISTDSCPNALAPANMRSPPKEVTSTWPAPNYINPETRGPALIIVEIVALCISTAFLALRLFVRIHILRSPDWDDWLMVVAGASSPAPSLLFYLVATRVAPDGGR
jgi:hypothetical protein